MLKKDFRQLETPESVDANTTLISKQKEMLINFIQRSNIVVSKPSEEDKRKLADVYYEGNWAFLVDNGTLAKHFIKFSLVLAQECFVAFL